MTKGLGRSCQKQGFDVAGGQNQKSAKYGLMFAVSGHFNGK